jgi:predicted nucleic acid-binding protein
LRFDGKIDHRYLAGAGRLQEIFYLWRPVLSDPADDHMLGIAVAGSCEAIVTHYRRDFRRAARFGIRIPTPAEFLIELEEESG